MARIRPPRRNCPACPPPRLASPPLPRLEQRPLRLRQRLRYHNGESRRLRLHLLHPCPSCTQSLPWWKLFRTTPRFPATRCPSLVTQKNSTSTASLRKSRNCTAAQIAWPKFPCRILKCFARNR